jgi:hypothetical protein
MGVLGRRKEPMALAMMYLSLAVAAGLAFVPRLQLSETGLTFYTAQGSMFAPMLTLAVAGMAVFAAALAVALLIKGKFILHCVLGILGACAVVAVHLLQPIQP